MVREKEIGILRGVIRGKINLRETLFAAILVRAGSSGRINYSNNFCSRGFCFFSARRAREKMASRKNISIPLLLSISQGNSISPSFLLRRKRRKKSAKWIFLSTFLLCLVSIKTDTIISLLPWTKSRCSFLEYDFRSFVCPSFKFARMRKFPEHFPLEKKFLVWATANL